MRHRKSGRKLNRDSAHRKALMMNLSSAIIEHGIIKTTLPKAKEVRRVIEPLITLAKKDSVANRRHAFKKLCNKEIVDKLFVEIAVASKSRPGGYTRILKCGYRKDDAAPMAYIELVDRSNNVTLTESDNSTQTIDTTKNSSTDELKKTQTKKSSGIKNVTENKKATKKDNEAHNKKSAPKENNNKSKEENAILAEKK